MKKLITIIFLVLVLLNLTQLPTWATDHPMVTKITERLTVAPTKEAALSDAKPSNVQSRADKMITERITSLQKLLTRVSGDKRLSSDEITSFTSDINTTITKLQDLKTKIDADTDVTTAIADTKSIVTTYRIYMIFEPKLRYLVTVDNLLTTNANLTTLATNISGYLTTLSSQGFDVSSLQTTLTDANSKLSDANTKLTQAKTALDAITVAQAGTDPFASVKTLLVQVRQDYSVVHTDFVSIRNGIKSLSKTAKASGTPIPHPSCILRPACLSAKFPCKIAEPSGGWCPTGTPAVSTPTP